MAGTKLMLNNRVSASSLLEVVVSMVVVMVILVLALTIFANVTRSSLSAKQLRAQTILNNLQIKAEDSTNVSTGEIIIDGWRVKQEIKSYDTDEALNEFDLTVYDENNDKIAESRKLIIIKS